MTRYRAVLLCAAATAAGCATLHKPGETPEGKAQDRYQCEKEAYDSRAHGLERNGLYRDCMRARGYK